MGSLPPTEDNVVGAVFFLSYILAALLFTFLIVFDITKAYVPQYQVLRCHDAASKNATSNNKQGVDTYLVTLVSLAILSFATLSYHMMQFLIVSYLEWTAEHLTLADDTKSFPDVLASLWSWMKTSTLFQDFATSICRTEERFLWTQSALLLSLGWNVWMAVEGKLVITQALVPSSTEVH